MEERDFDQYGQATNFYGEAKYVSDLELMAKSITKERVKLAAERQISLVKGGFRTIDQAATYINGLK
jgi:hypothetical protein